ncbi:MAG: cytochrome D1 domain-containing protein [Gammaproteobacteria bacterium]
MTPRIAFGLLACAIGAWAPTAHAGRAYVSNEDGHTVTVLDTARAEVISTIAVGKRPRGLKLSSDGSRLFVAVSGLPKCPPSVPDEECAKLKRDLTADGIAIVDTRSHKVIGVLQAGSDPEQFDMSADGRRLFVANEDIATTTVLDIESGDVVARIPVGREPEGVATTPNGRWVLVTNESDNSVSFIDTRTLKVVKSVQVGKRPRDVAFTPDGKTAYVSGEFDASLYRISVPGGDPVERVLELRKEARPMAVLLDARRSRLYISTGRGGTVAVVDLKGPKLIAEIPVGTRPWGIALSADGRWLYTANGPSNDVSLIDMSTLRVVKQISVGRSPWGVVVGPVPPEDKPAKPTASRRGLPEPAGLPGLGLQVAVELGHASRPLRVAEDRSVLPGQRCVSRERRGFDEVVVAQAPRNPIDCARTLVQVRELSALHDAVVHIFDSRVRRVVMSDRIAPDRPGRRQEAGHAGERQTDARVA